MTGEREFLEQTAGELREPADLAIEALRGLTAALGEHAGEHRRLLDMAERGMRKVLRTSERLALTARLSADEDEQGQPVDLVDMLREAVRDTSYLDGRRNVELVFTEPSGAFRTLAEPEALQLGLCEATAQAVRSAKKRVEVTLEPCERGTMLRVRDDGPGTQRAALARPEAGPQSGPRTAALLSLELALLVARRQSLDVTLRELEPTGFEFTWLFALSA